MSYFIIGILLFNIGVVAAHVYTNSRTNFVVYSPKISKVTVGLPYQIQIIMAFHAPKEWKLTTEESLSSYLTWQHNVLYNLSLDKDFASFIAPNSKWEIKDTSETHGLLADAGDNGESAKSKSAKLELMLGNIANYCLVLARDKIANEITSIHSVWKCICSHYSFDSRQQVPAIWTCRTLLKAHKKSQRTCLNM